MEFENEDYNLLDQRDSYMDFQDNEPFNENLSQSTHRTNFNDDMHQIMEENEDEDTTIKLNQDELVEILLKGD